jgi:hypothetical protein
LLPLEAIASISGRGEDLSPNFNRYLMRSVDMDHVRGRNINFTFSKLGRFAILGFIREDRLNRWQGMKVHVKHGQIEPRKYTLPREFLEYLNSKARREAELFSRISARQLEKIDRAFRANVDKFAGSDACLAMQYDLRMFGDAAFAPENPK